MVVISRATRRHGVSLLEMIIALVVFSAIVFPVVSITTTATDQLEDHKNTSVAKFEWTMFFGDFQKAVGLSYKFFPMNVYLAKYGNPSSCTSLPVGDSCLNSTQQIFMAYVDTSKNPAVEKRVGYQFKPVAGHSDQFRLEFVDIQGDAIANESVTNGGSTTYKHTIGGTEWKEASKTLDTAEYYFKSAVPNTSGPKFVYCKGNFCGSSVLVDQADGVRIQAGDADSPENLVIVYRNSEIEIQPIYLKLAGLQFNQTASMLQLSPFPLDVNTWNTARDWVAEVGDWTVSPVLRPVGNQDEANGTLPASGVGNFSKLRLNDMHYNTTTGELLAVTNSTSSSISVNGTAVSRNFYIFKFAPGKADTPRYRLQIGGATYEDAFPIVIKSGDAAYISPNAVYKSVTQDRFGNIYVLAQDGAAYYIQKFSSTGAYISKFTLETGLGGVYGITFSPLPGNDQNVMALVNTATTGPPVYKIRWYNKDQNGFGALQSSAPKPPDAGSDISVTLAAPPVGFDYDTARNHFIVQLDDCSIKSLKATDTTVVAGFILKPSNDVSCFTSQGVAYDATRNMLYVSTTTFDYRRAVSTVLLNAGT